MTNRTSLSHPLLIDSVACGTGLIGMTLCPGKKGDSVYGAPWDRDLDLDLQAIVDWGATTLVTLMEAHEFPMLGVPDLGSCAEEIGLEWHHLPIPDVSVPEKNFDTFWTYSGHLLRRKLSGGEKIVLHCRGGLGRTGLIAARLLIEFGVAAENAISQVRETRKGAIETFAQEKYALGVQSLSVNEVYAEKVLGCLLGGAVGDAFGYAIEFDSLDVIRKKYGPDGLKAPVFQDGKLIVSDDTQMTLFTAEGLVKSNCKPGSVDPSATLEAIRVATLDWHQTQSAQFPAKKAFGNLVEHKALWKLRAPGNTCLSACKKGANGTPEKPINGSKGCGGVMRVAPIGLCPNLVQSEAFDLAARAAAQTHGHPSGYISAGFLAAIIRDALDGIDPGKSSHQVFGLAHGWTGAEETVGAVSLARANASHYEGDLIDALAEIGEGWVGEEALGIGLLAIFRTDSFVDALRMAANHSGDSDSTASIAGQIHGAWKGLEGIPHAWIRRLDVLEPILEIAARIIRTFGNQYVAPTTSHESELVVPLGKPTPSSLAWVRRSQRLIRMVSELHRMGYQRLRIMPYEYPLAWRLKIAPITAFARLNGAYIPEMEREFPSYSSSDANEYFGWRDAKNDNARELAEKFVDRFPEVVKAGAGRDWIYAGWLAELVSHLEHGDFLPVVLAEAIEIQPHRLKGMPIVEYGEHGGNWRINFDFPLPPLGEIDDDRTQT